MGNSWDDASLAMLQDELSQMCESERLLLIAMLQADGELPELLRDHAEVSRSTHLVQDALLLRQAVGRAMAGTESPAQLRAAVKEIAHSTNSIETAPVRSQEAVLGRIGRWVPLAMAAGLLVVTAVTVRSFLPGAPIQSENTANAGFALRLASDFATQDAVPAKDQTCGGDIDIVKRFTQMHLGSDPVLRNLVSDPTVRVIGRDACKIPPRTGEPCVKIRLSVASDDDAASSASLFITKSLAFLPESDRDNSNATSVYKIPICSSTANKAITGWRADGLSYMVVAPDESTNEMLRSRLGVNLQPVELPGCAGDRKQGGR
ncbi:MAG: hypothetical protein H6815_06525 [Phycisphaeraceae bacterium]|nr:hypothetical protein [Phycisphaerales bacterium]MCB9860093.1 hypothetical protein [Phycisphaeraceae bacterium]